MFFTHGKNIYSSPVVGITVALKGSATNAEVLPTYKSPIRTMMNSFPTWTSFLGTLDAPIVPRTCVRRRKDILSTQTSHPSASDWEDSSDATLRGNVPLHACSQFSRRAPSKPNLQHAGSHLSVGLYLYTKSFKYEPPCALISSCTYKGLKARGGLVYIHMMCNAKVELNFQSNNLRHTARGIHKKGGVLVNRETKRNTSHLLAPLPYLVRHLVRQCTVNSNSIKQKMLLSTDFVISASLIGLYKEKEQCFCFVLCLTLRLE